MLDFDRSVLYGMQLRACEFARARCVVDVFVGLSFQRRVAVPAVFSAPFKSMILRRLLHSLLLTGVLAR